MEMKCTGCNQMLVLAEKWLNANGRQWIMLFYPECLQIFPIHSFSVADQSGSAENDKALSDACNTAASH